MKKIIGIVVLMLFMSNAILIAEALKQEELSVEECNSYFDTDGVCSGNPKMTVGVDHGEDEIIRVDKYLYPTFTVSQEEDEYIITLNTEKGE